MGHTREGCNRRKDCPVKQVGGVTCAWCHMPLAHLWFQDRCVDSSLHDADTSPELRHCCLVCLALWDAISREQGWWISVPGSRALEGQS